MKSVIWIINTISEMRRKKKLMKLFIICGYELPLTLEDMGMKEFIEVNGVM